MSLVFSNSETKAGIVELIDATLKTNSVTYPIAEKVRDVNLALDRALTLIFQAAGTWQFDDSNHADLPIITTTLVSGQRDYSFDTDGSGNVILDIFKVLFADPQGTFHELKLRDQQSQRAEGFTDGLNQGGTPRRYDMTGNTIFLDPIPNYDAAGGLKVYINRESSYFEVTDTDKKPGIAGPFHEYLALYAALKYATRNAMPVAGGTMRGGFKTGLLADVYEMEQQMITYYGSRERDGRKVLKAALINFR